MKYSSIFLKQECWHDANAKIVRLVVNHSGKLRHFEAKSHGDLPGDGFKHFLFSPQKLGK